MKSIMFGFKNVIIIAIINKLLFAMLDISFAFGYINNARSFMEAQAVMLLAIPVSLYFGSSVVLNIKRKLIFSTLSFFILLLSFLLDLTSGSENFYMTLCASMSLSLIYQNIMMRFYSLLMQLTLSTLHIGFQLLIFAANDGDEVYMLSTVISLLFCVSSMSLAMRSSITGDYTRPFMRVWWLGLSLNSIRSLISFSLRYLLISSSMSWLLIIQRFSNQIISTVFSIMLGKGVKGISVNFKSRMLFYSFPIFLGLFLSAYLPHAAPISTATAICAVFELAYRESKILKVSP